MTNNSNKKVADIVFVVFMAIMLAAFPVLYIVLPQKNESGNQQLEQIPKFSGIGFLNTSFQTSMEQALKDQFVFHNTAMETVLGGKGALRKVYNNIQTLFTGETGLVPYGEVDRMYGSNYLTNLPYRYNEEDVLAYQKKAEEINSFAKKYTDANVFVYYCTRAEDLNWFDSTEGFESFSYINYLESLLSDNVYFTSSRIQDFGDYCQKRYKTDHHWTNAGANWGYIEILSLMQTKLELSLPKSIAATQDFNNLEWIGSRYRESAISAEKISPDTFKVDKYILPAHKTYFNDEEMAIGLSEEYEHGEVIRDIVFDQYLNYYGFESAPIRLEYGKGKYNLLIIGDSFTRAVREPLASHFNTTLFINFRLLDEVDIENLMQQYNFDAVLFMGQQDAFSGYFMQ